MVGNGPLDSRLDLPDFIGMNGNWDVAPDIGQHGFPGGDSVRSGSSALGGGFFCLGVRPGFFEEIFRGANFGTTLFGLFFQGLWALARSTTRWSSWPRSRIQLHGRPEEMQRERFFGSALFCGPTFEQRTAK